MVHRFWVSVFCLFLLANSLPAQASHDGEQPNANVEFEKMPNGEIREKGFDAENFDYKEVGRILKTTSNKFGDVPKNDCTATRFSKSIVITTADCIDGKKNSVNVDAIFDGAKTSMKCTSHPGYTNFVSTTHQANAPNVAICRIDAPKNDGPFACLSSSLDATQRALVIDHWTNPLGQLQQGRNRISLKSSNPGYGDSPLFLNGTLRSASSTFAKLDPGAPWGRMRPVGNRKELLVRGISSGMTTQNGKNFLIATDLTTFPIRDFIATYMRKERIPANERPCGSTDVPQSQFVHTAPVGKFEDRDQGVLVTDVPKNSPLGRAFLLPGDLITAVNGVSLFQNGSYRARELDRQLTLGGREPLYVTVTRPSIRNPFRQTLVVRVTPGELGAGLPTPTKQENR